MTHWLHALKVIPKMRNDNFQSSTDDSFARKEPAAVQRIGSTRRRVLALTPLMTGLPAMLRSAGAAESAGLASRTVPARVLPVPETVSPELRVRIAAPYPREWDVIPSTPDAWKDLAVRSSAAVAPHLSLIRERLKVHVEPGWIAGVPIFTVTPDDMPPENRDRLLVHLHGGGFVLYPGEAGAGEAMLMAGYGRSRSISVDYRMAPDFPFPAALADAATVWRSLTREHDPQQMGIYGSSAGGGLTLALLLQARAEGLPLPAAVAPGTPWADLTGAGDSLQANAYVDNVLVANTGWARAAASLYAGGHDLREPLVSPVFGNFSDFPPAILTSGTRDLFLSHTVRTHRKFRQAGIEAVLQVFEGQSHAQFLDPFVPETEEAFGEIARFFATHLRS
jgi:monoterpene epsilon-lactone hydrolase